MSCISDYIDRLGSIGIYWSLQCSGIDLTGGNGNSDLIETDIRRGRSIGSILSSLQTLNAIRNIDGDLAKSCITRIGIVSSVRRYGLSL